MLKYVHCLTIVLICVSISRGCNYIIIFHNILLNILKLFFSEQVRAGLMSVCFKEKIKISSDLIDQIIVGCNY
jgi:hypothetical protein